MNKPHPQNMIDLNSVNGYGVPLHACNGYIHDGHYWARIRHLIASSDEPLYVWARSLKKGQS
jgi:hypothetical protein